MSARRRRLVTGSSLDIAQNHRGDLETCPHCSHVPPEDRSWYGRGLILVLQPRVQRANSVALLSDCPKCFELSWVHVQIDSVKYAVANCPADWVLAVENLERTKKLQALRDWGAGICHRCARLDSGTVDYKAWRNCDIGMGPPETKCNKFKALAKAGQERRSK